jgi:hypothetical protein
MSSKVMIHPIGADPMITSMITPVMTPVDKMLT